MDHVLARCNSTQIVDRDGEIWILGKRTPPSGLIGTLVVVAVMLLLDGMLAAIGFFVGGWVRIGLACFLIAAGLALAYGIVVLRLRYLRATSNDPGPPLIIAGGRLLDAQRRDLAAVGDVRYRKIGQITSSSRALVLEWPGARTVIARGSPFADSIAGCVHILQRHGIAKA